MPIPEALDPSQHWDSAYSPGDTTKSWYQSHAKVSCDLIQRNSSPADSIIDVGGGASTLVDDLLNAGYADLTVLDTSRVGLDIAKQRLGRQGADVDWLVADLREWQPQRTFDVWHDRAVLHFFTTTDDRERYVSALVAATHPGSLVVIGVFGPDGPNQCSGLEVSNFAADDVADLLGARFQILSSQVHDHSTPSGTSQQFLWVTAQRLA